MYIYVHPRCFLHILNTHIYTQNIYIHFKKSKYEVKKEWGLNFLGEWWLYEKSRLKERVQYIHTYIHIYTYTPVKRYTHIHIYIYIHTYDQSVFYSRLSYSYIVKHTTTNQHIYIYTHLATTHIHTSYIHIPYMRHTSVYKRKSLSPVREKDLHTYTHTVTHIQYTYIQHTYTYNYLYIYTYIY